MLEVPNSLIPILTVAMVLLPILTIGALIGILGAWTYNCLKKRDLS